MPNASGPALEQIPNEVGSAQVSTVLIRVARENRRLRATSVGDQTSHAQPQVVERLSPHTFPHSSSVPHLSQPLRLPLHASHPKREHVRRVDTRLRRLVARYCLRSQSVCQEHHLFLPDGG